jgi:hypothetical protein
LTTTDAVPARGALKGDVSFQSAIHTLFAQPDITIANTMITTFEKLDMPLPRMTINPVFNYISGKKWLRYQLYLTSPVLGHTLCLPELLGRDNLGPEQ